VVEKAKLFWSGRSQAVRLPKDFRIAGDEVRIRRHGSAIILEPVATDWSWLDALVGRFDADAAEAALESAEEQARPDLDKLFP
jgi:antitoxin VapB